MKRWTLAMLTIVVALVFSMEQADLGVVQSLHGKIECIMHHDGDLLALH